jgi:hypothetical protein
MQVTRSGHAMAGSRDDMAMMKMKKHAIPMIVLVLVLSGCKPIVYLTQTSVPPPVDTVSTHRPFTMAAAPSSIPGAPESPTQAPEAVIVTAVKGNLFIRRGPDLAYNAVSVLVDGQSGRAVARDVLGGWLQIFIPDHPQETGWISIQSRYSEVKGDLMSLPEFMPTDWPAQAWLRNCTEHQMLVNPAGILISAVNNFPDNEVQLNPGVYTVHDIEVDGSPEVMELEIREGSEEDILDDGDGDHRKCPSS